MNSRHRIGLSGVLSLLLLADVGQAEQSRGFESESDAEWQVLGSFSGASASGWLNRINNWLFEYERDDSLFQDLGDFGVGVGISPGEFELDWDSYFKRKVVLAHDELQPGDTVTEDDLSRYRTLSRARTRLRLRWDYLPDLVGQIGVGLEVEGGYSLAIARSHEPRVVGDVAFEPINRTKTTRELRQFFRDNDLSMDSDLIDVLFGSMAAVTNKAMGEIGERTADTEKASIFFDGYAEPMTYLTVSNLPPSGVLFTAEDSPVQVGDAITFTTFAGFSPLRASAREYGLLISVKKFRRYIRETTVLKEADNVMLVRVRKLLWNGNEFIPIKFRPRIRIFSIIKLAYTFFDIKRDSYRQTVSDVTYRIDLNNPVAKDFFLELVETATRVQRHPPPLSFDMRPGVETLRSELRTGRTRDNVKRVRFFNWVSLREAHITSIHDVQTADAEVREVVRARIHEYRFPFGKKHRYRSRSVITSQADAEDPTMVHAGSETHEGEYYATTIETSVSAPKATGADIRSLGANLQTILGYEDIPEEFKPLVGLPDEALSGLTFDLLLSFGPDQAEQLANVTETQLWIVLADLLLGSQYRGAWSTPKQRFWWQPSSRSHGLADQMDRHITDHYDDLRDFNPVQGRNIGFSPSQYSSRRLFIMASHLVDKFQGIQKVIREGDCLKCMAKVFAKASDVVILQALLVRFAGGVESDAVGFRAEVFSNEMGAPAKVGNDVTYTYRHQQVPEILGDVELAREPAPRLRGGELLLHVPDPDSEVATGVEQPCWKIRLYSDLQFEESTPLRVFLRDDPGLGRDRVILAATIGLGEPRPVPQTPFMVSRYYYDVPLPWKQGLREKKTYTLLVRVINSDGLPVSEEQEIRLQLPEDWEEMVPGVCAPGPEPLVANAGHRAVQDQAAFFVGMAPFSSLR